MALRSSSLVILLAYGALIILIFLTPCWYVMVLRMEKRVNMNSKNMVSQLQSQIEHSAELLHPMKSSSTNLVRYLSSSLDPANISFSDIENKVAPLLFQAFETIPYLAQISYIGMEGLFFSYYTYHDQVLAMYTNSSSSSFGASNITFIQPVNRDTGRVYGEVMDIISNPFINASWIAEALNNNMSNEFASIGTKWGNDSYILFLNSARISTRGVISFGFSSTEIADFVTSNIDQQGTKSYLATKDGKVLVEGIQHNRFVILNDTVSFESVNGNGNLKSNECTISCKDEAVASSLNILDAQYLIHCHTIDIMGIESVHVLAVPQNRLVSSDLMNYKKKGLALFVVTMITIFIALFSFLFTNWSATRQEMHLRASLIKEREATQQADKKNMNKSIAFASASHDVRASLAGITGLIEISHELVAPGSELDTNLKQMNDSTHDLLGLLNSILDTSKIEAGKMQVEEEEFEVSHLLEDVVDFYYPVAMKKRVDLVLDPCNGSIMRYSSVKGDRGKLKQVLSNLLSNAVKFTDKGHIAVRAWTQKPRLQNSTVTSNHFGFKKYLSRIFCNKNEAHDDMESMHSIQEETHTMDFIFEVDDTGRGIPKENYKAVFENYVQVKETALGQGGTGLGLGIVQSLVRLMHGDIEIVEKDTGDKGTCFRFNVLLTLCESETMTNGSTREGIECGSRDRKQVQGQTMHSTSSSASSSSRIRSMSPRLHVCGSSPKPEASLVVLLIADKERRRTAQRFMERLGIKVKVVKAGKHLFYTLKKIKQKHQHSSESSDMSFHSTSHNSLAMATRVPPSFMDGIDHMPSVFNKKANIGTSPGFILIVIDANAGQFHELFTIVSSFKEDLHNPCKVVWLDKPFIRSINNKALDHDDTVISKPFHGSRLFQTIKLLPEFGGLWQSNSSNGKRKSTYERAALKTSKDSNLLKYNSPLLDKSLVSPSHENKFQSEGKIWNGNGRSMVKLTPIHKGEIRECGESSGYHKALNGKKFLVVEDSALLCKLALATLISLGATMEQCENGEQAVRSVEKGLTQNSPYPPYDYILMDCQMPVMDGFEATKWIRKIEKPYGFRIPIIALTASTDTMTEDTGIDFHIVKPIRREHLLEAIRYLHDKA